MPGVGNTFSAAGELLVGCGIMIKNSVGVAALVVLAAICLAPLLKVFCFHVMYRLTAALLEPFCDRRIAECVQGVGRGCALYLRLLRDVLLLFWITVAMIGASTSFIY
jgi:stage III sporulation protein AE